MGPKKSKKNREEDEEFDKIEANSKLAQLLKTVEKTAEEQQVDASDLYIKKDKEIFNFDFSNERAIYMQKIPEKKPQPIIELTPQQLQALEKRLQKQQIEREAKEKIKKQKKQQRKKLLDQQKEQQRLIKEQQQKQEEYVEKKIKSTQKSDGKYIPLCFLICLLLLGLLQYQKQIYTKLSKFKLNDEINFYEILQADSGATDQELKAKYKKLVMKYHPDKNTNCKTCKDKFNQIMKAWQILGNPQKRKHYDQNSGYISQIKSESITLTPQNYNDLVQNSNSLWIIQVYDSTNEYCHYFSQFWQEVIHLNNDLINFGRIDVWHQTDMLSYIPYRFQVFPGIYAYQQGEIKMCELNYHQPLASVTACIDSNYQENLFIKINSLDQIKGDPTKKSIIFGGEVKIGSKIKIIHKKYQKYFNYYKISNKENVITLKNSNFTHKFVENSKSLYKRYENFLKSLIIQQKSICEVSFLCENEPCILIIQKDSPMPQQHKYPLFSIRQSQEFSKKIEIVKNSTGMLQKFDLGLYQSGRIQLGYADEIHNLNADNGQFIDLTCVKLSFFEKIQEIYKKIWSFGTE